MELIGPVSAAVERLTFFCPDALLFKRLFLLTSHEASILTSQHFFLRPSLAFCCFCAQSPFLRSFADRVFTRLSVYPRIGQLPQRGVSCILFFLGVVVIPSETVTSGAGSGSASPWTAVASWDRFLRRAMQKWPARARTSGSVRLGRPAVRPPLASPFLSGFLPTAFQSGCLMSVSSPYYVPVVAAAAAAWAFACAVRPRHDDGLTDSQAGRGQKGCSCRQAAASSAKKFD